MAFAHSQTAHRHPGIRLPESATSRHQFSASSATAPAETTPAPEVSCWDTSQAANTTSRLPSVLLGLTNCGPGVLYAPPTWDWTSASAISHRLYYASDLATVANVVVIELGLHDLEQLLAVDV